MAEYFDPDEAKREKAEKTLRSMCNDLGEEPREVCHDLVDRLKDGDIKPSQFADKMDGLVGITLTAEEVTPDTRIVPGPAEIVPGPEEVVPSPAVMSRPFIAADWGTDPPTITEIPTHARQEEETETPVLDESETTRIRAQVRDDVQEPEEGKE